MSCTASTSRLTGPGYSLLLGLLCIASLVDRSGAECFIEKAIADTELCSNTFQHLFDNRKFNASSAQDLKEACCSMERLERCLQAASTDAGCRDEVRFIVEHMSQTARRLLHSLYRIQCNKYDCTSSAMSLVGSILSPWSLLLTLVALILPNLLTNASLAAR